MRKWDTEQWEIELQNKSTMKMYREKKKKIGYEFCYRNDFSSTYLAKARTNSLKLGDWFLRQKKNKIRGNCLICGNDVEDLIYFVSECKGLDRFRPPTWIRMREEFDPDVATRVILFKNKEDWFKTSRTLEKMWQHRRYVEKQVGGR